MVEKMNEEKAEKSTEIKCGKCETKNTPDWVFHLWMLTTDGSLSTIGDFWIGVDNGITGLAGNLYHRLTESEDESDNWTNEVWSTVPCGSWVLNPFSGDAAMTITEGLIREKTVQGKIVQETIVEKGIYTGYKSSPHGFQWNGSRYSLDKPSPYPLCPIMIMREERAKFQPQ